MAYVTTETGHRIYFEHHRGTKLPVLLVDGWGTSCRVWDTTLSALQAAGLPVAVVNPREARLCQADGPSGQALHLVCIAGSLWCANRTQALARRRVVQRHAPRRYAVHFVFLERVQGNC